MIDGNTVRNAGYFAPTELAELLLWPKLLDNDPVLLRALKSLVSLPSRPAKSRLPEYDV